MKVILSLILVVGFALSAFGQNERAPMVEKKIDYENWTYPNVLTGAETNLRTFVRGKKLVMVVYWAPWCPNWKHDAAFVQGLYEKYKGNGFDVIGVAAYDPVSSMKSHIEQYKLTFPSVYETEKRDARLTSKHYTYRTAVGDRRKWGTPFYIFLDGKTPEPTGNIQAETAPVVPGELMKEDVEKYIREKLGLSAEKASAELEICEPEKKITALVKP